MLHFAKYVLYFALILIPFSPAAIAATDSANIQSGHTISPKMPTTETSVNATSRTAELITSTDFTNMSGCPGDPSRIAHHGSWPATPQCPNDNGVWPSSVTTNGQVYDPVKGRHIAATEANCPATCTATRYIERDINDNPVALTEASCPTGYLMVGTYGMEPEYVSTAEPQTIPAPITWTDYQTYKAQYYHCTADTPSYQTINTCPDANSAIYTTYASRVTLNNGTTDDSDGPDMQDSSGRAGVWRPLLNYRVEDGGSLSNVYTGYCYYDGANCVTEGNLVAGWVRPGETGCTPTSAYNVRVYYDFYYYSCIRPAGSVVQTSYTAPASVVCARISTEWRSPN